MMRMMTMMRVKMMTMMRMKTYQVSSSAQSSLAIKTNIRRQGTQDEDDDEDDGEGDEIEVEDDDDEVDSEDDDEADDKEDHDHDGCHQFLRGSSLVRDGWEAANDESKQSTVGGHSSSFSLQGWRAQYLRVTSSKVQQRMSLRGRFSLVSCFQISGKVKSISSSFSFHIFGQHGNLYLNI